MMCVSQGCRVPELKVETYKCQDIHGGECGRRDGQGKAERVQGPVEKMMY